MASFQEVMDQLRAAHNAGDVDLAKRLAAQARALRGTRENPKGQRAPEVSARPQARPPASAPPAMPLGGTGASPVPLAKDDLLGLLGSATVPTPPTAPVLPTVMDPRAAPAMSMPGATPGVTPVQPPVNGGATPVIPTDLVRLLSGEAATGGAMGMPDYGTPTTFTAPTDSVKKRPEPKPSAPAEPPEPVLDLAKRRGQEFVQGASGILQSVARARGIKEETLAAAIKRDAPDRVKEAARRIQSLEGILSRGISDSGVGPMTDQERAKYQRDLAEAGEAFKQWSDVQEFGPAFAGNRTKGAEKTAKTIKDWTDETFGVPPKDDSIWSDLAYGGGSMVGFVAPAVLAGPLGLPVTAQMGSDVARVEAYDRAIAAGASDEDAQAAANLAGLMGTMEAVPIGHALNRLPKPVRDDVLGRLGRFSREAVLDGTEEAMQEAFAALSQNLIAKGIYDPEQKVITGDVTDQALVGFILGAFLGGSVNIARRDREDEMPKPPKQSPEATSDEPVQPGAATGGDMDYPRLSPMAPMPDSRVNVDPGRPERPPEPAPGAAPNRVFSNPGKINSDPKSGRYEVVPEIYVDPETGEESLTGRQVRVDTTGQEPPVVVDEPAAERDAAEGSGPGGSGSSARPAPDADAPAPVAPRRPREVADGGKPDAAPDPRPEAAPEPGPQRVFLSNNETLAIGTDADAFQYKGGGDAQGVTDRLQGVTGFDPERAGRAIVYEKADGSRVIADGHQRLGLAKRAAEAGQSDVGGMAATVYREADGYSAADVRVISALKNIAEGSGTALDAARVLRDSNQSLDGLNLPPKSALVRDAEGLRRLSDGAFGMVANGVATEQHGAIVGREVADADAHASILKLLGRLNPRNAEQAAIIARDAAADTAKSEAADLFGSQKDTDTLYLERARVLDSAVKGLKKDKATFSRLVQEGDKIEGAGNKLDADANTRRVEDDAKVLEYLQRQANTKGPISDALSKAARDLKAGRSLSQVAKQFVGDVQGALSADGATGDSGGRGSETAGPRPEAEGGTPEREVTPAPKPDTDLFGEKPVTDKERAEAEMSKPKRGGDAPPPGGRGDLFGDPSDRADLFDDEPASKPHHTAGKYVGESSGPTLNFTDDSSGWTDLDPGNLGAGARNYVLQKGRETDVENIVIFDGAGGVHAVGRGKKNSVNFPNDIKNILFQDRDESAVIHHNHPSGNSFSPADLYFAAFPGVHSVYAHGHDGTSYRVAATPLFKRWQEKHGLAKSEWLSQRFMNGIDRLVQPRLQAIYDSRFVNGMTSAEGIAKAKEAEQSFDPLFTIKSHLYLETLQRAGLVDYKTNRNTALDEAYRTPEIEKAIATVASMIKGEAKKAGVLSDADADRPAIQFRQPGDVGGLPDGSPRTSQRNQGRPDAQAVGAAGKDGGETGRPDEGQVRPSDDFEAALEAQLKKRGKGPASKKDSGTSKTATSGGTDTSPTPSPDLIPMAPPPAKKPGKRSAAARTKDIKNILKGGGLAEDAPVFRKTDTASFKRWFGDSKVVDEAGAPLIVYHGAAADFEAFKPGTMIWASSENGYLSNAYAATRGIMNDMRNPEVGGEHGNQIYPLYMRAAQVFDADLGLPKTVTAPQILNAIVEQAQDQGRTFTDTELQRLSDLASKVRRAARREESGPHYARHDFWNDTRSLFGEDGASAIEDTFKIAGFDGITMVEAGEKTYGVFSPEQVKSVFNRGTFDPYDVSMLREDAAPDPVYEQLTPIFQESLESDPSGRPRVEVFGEMIGPMLDEGLTADEVRALRPYFERFLDEVDAGTIDWQGDQDAAPGGRVEPNSGAAAPDGVGADGVPDAAGPDGQGGGAGARGAGARAGRAGGERLPGGDAASVGVRGRGEGQGDRALSPGQRAADGDAAAGRDRGKPGLRPDDGRAEDTRREAADSPDRVSADPKSQPTAHHREVAKAVPALRPEQVDDVVRIERRFFKPEEGKKKGLGMLITNGTGTGKTMTGLGAAKRFVDRGAKAVLVVVKTQGEVNNWVRHADLVDTKVAPMQSTTDNGKDARAPIVVTTYANIEDNKALVDREWDFIVSDESHMLMSNAQGEETKALRTLRTIANKPSHLFEKELRKRRADMEKAEKIKNEEARQNAKAAIFMEARRASEAAQKKGVKQSNVLFMSATPFAYDKNVDYAEGYLFDYPDSETREGSRQDGRTWFMVENFGYRVRYHKLTQPEAAVDRGVFHREFHERLKREGSLWGRKLDVPTDYDRKFVTVSSDLGNKIETALDYLRKKSSEKNADPAWRQVEKRVQSSFRYHQRQQLLEAIKAKEAMADIRGHVDMGRKVVVFHDFNVGGGTNPFSIPVGEGEAMYDQYMQMYADLPWLADLPIERMAPPKEQVLREFGARAREYNGTVSKKERQKAADEFNRDGSGVDVIVVQSDAGSGGISLHDTTGGHKRVLVNLGMPVKPTTSLQAEGRTRRVGSVSDSPYRYYTIGTTWERQAFARRIAEQSGAVENLAMGNEARAIKQSFIDAYEAADRNPPSENDGKGGLQKDTVANNLSDFDRAKSHYFGRQKMKGKRDQRKGFDFFPTPEPLGYKMAEWAQIRPYDKVLEPSAGDGAISRYFPEHADRTILEPEADLLTKAELRTSGARARRERFEDLPIVNKYDAVVMNPPFGRGGKTAFEHVKKAMMHTRPGGRVVALVPKGPAATRQFELMMDRLGKAALEWNMTAAIDLPPVTFERAGTAVQAEVMIFDRIMDTDGMRPTAGINLNNGPKTIGDFFDRLEGIAVPDRPPRMGASGVDADMDAADAAAQVEVDRPAIGAPLTGDGETVDKFDVFEFNHSQTGEKMFGAKVREKLGRERYKAVAAVAKQHGGYYSKYQNKDAGAKRGFLFKTDEARRAFIEDLGKPVQGLEESAFREDTGPFKGWEEHRPMIPGGTVMDFDAVSRMLPKLRSKLDAMNLKRVTLGVEAGATGRQGVTYAQGPGQIDILISQAIDPEATLYHESIHAMRAMNLFTPQEWAVLQRGAEKRWIDKHDIRKRYPDLTPSEQIEEAIAEEFAEAATTKTRPGNSFVVRAFNKIHRFLKALRNAVQGNGMQTAEDIFGKALAGQIGARDAGNTGIAATLKAAEMRAPSARQAQRQNQGGQQAGAQPPRLPPHIPDRRLWNELTASNVSIFERLRGAGGAIYDAVDKARFQVQDRMLPVLRAQQAIENAVGAPLPSDMNAYQTEVTYSGKAGRKLFEVDEEFTKPIIGIIAKSKGALDAEIVGQWLTARHAEERNRHVASINPAMPDGGSGMTNAEAQALLAQWAARPQAADLQRIGDLVDQMRDYTLRMRLESGLMSARDYMIWKNQYDAYVPLKGYAEVDGAEGTLDMTGIGRRYNTRGPESMRALGRGEGNLAFNPLVAAITQAKEVAIRSEKNRVGQALYRLAKAHPSKALWTVKTPKQKRYYNRTTGLVETRVEPAVTPRQEVNEFAVKIDGKEHRIVFHDQRLTEAINNVGYDGMQGIVRWLGAYTRFQSAVLTMLNPEFVVRNAFRDFQTAIINLPEMTDQKGFGKAVAKNWRKAFMGVYRGMGYKDDTEWSRHYREFEESGAKISFWTLDDPVVGRSDLEKRIDLARGPRAARILKAALKAPFSTRDNKALGWIERVNLSVDNAVRLAAFVEARKRGMSQQDAANLSKNLTVNFNRRGKQVWLNSVFLFFNAAMQGMQTFARVMFSKHGAKVGGALLTYGMVEDMVNAALSEEDDDGELAYDKIPDYQSNRNFIWMARGGDDGTWGVGQMDDAWKIPMPYVYSLPVVYGRKISQVLRGVKDKDEAFLEAALATASDVSPLQFGSPVDMVTPTLLKDALEFRNNEDWLDRPIRPEYQFNDYGPMAYKHYVGVSELSRVAADKVNRWTGGNAARSGWLDVSPEYIDHAIGTATGSAGTFWMDSIDIALKAATGATGIIEPHRVPFVSEVSLETGPWLDRSNFFERYSKVMDAKKRVKIAGETGEPARPVHYILEEMSKKAAKLFKARGKLDDQRMSVRLNRDLTQEERAKEYKRIERELQPIYDEMNRVYLRLEKEVPDAIPDTSIWRDRFSYDKASFLTSAAQDRITAANEVDGLVPLKDLAYSQLGDIVEQSQKRVADLMDQRVDVRLDDTLTDDDREKRFAAIDAQLQPIYRAVAGAAAEMEAGIVTSVTDGDTFRSGKLRVRLSGINAPEMDEPGGEAAKQALADMIYGKPLLCSDKGKDTFGRQLASCRIENGDDIGTLMISIGKAVPYRH